MGRARRKDGVSSKMTEGRWPPELEDLQRRGGMSPDWHQATHGRGRGVDSVGQANTFSVVFPGPRPEDYEALRREDQDPLYRLSLLESYNEEALQDLDVDDPFVQALWEQERLRIEGWMKLAGAPPVNWDALEDGWKEFFVYDAKRTLGVFETKLVYYSLLGYILPQSRGSSFISPEQSQEILGSLEEWSQRQPTDFRDFVQTELLLALHHTLDVNSPLGEKIAFKEETFQAIVDAALPSTEDTLLWRDMKSQTEDVFDLSPQEENSFRNACLYFLGANLALDNSYPDGRPEEEGWIVSRAYFQGMQAALGHYFERLRDREDFEDQMKRSFGEEWPEIRSELLEMYPEDELQERVASRLSGTNLGVSDDFVDFCKGEISGRALLRNLLV